MNPKMPYMEKKTFQHHFHYIWKCPSLSQFIQIHSIIVIRKKESTFGFCGHIVLYL